LSATAAATEYPFHHLGALDCRGSELEATVAGGADQVLKQ